MSQQSKMTEKNSTSETENKNKIKLDPDILTVQNRISMKSTFHA